MNIARDIRPLSALRRETLIGIREGLDDIRAGRTEAATKIFAALDRKYGLADCDFPAHQDILRDVPDHLD